MTVSNEIINSLKPFGTFLGAMLTLGILSILYKENPVYRICEHIFVGAASAHGIVTTFANTIKPGIQVNMIQKGQWWELLAIAIGLMIYFQPIKKLTWISRIPMALWLGYNAGYALTIRTAMPLFSNITSSFKDIWVIEQGGFNFLSSLNNLIFIVALILTMVYFFFSVEMKGPMVKASQLARAFMMIAFGYSFGSTLMSRVSLFLGRLQFLFSDWLGLL
ncbi:MAG: hypothetical protein LLG09_04195 [Negativicutes bacterium]|nr:hypothetical protein [Negativicutes bacterium]